MDSFLTTEKPLIRKCCFVIPLRFCLQTWAFIKLAGDLVAMGYIAINTIMMIAYYRDHALTITLLPALVELALAVDVGFLILLTVGIFKKSINLIRVFFIYEWVAMAVETSLFIFMFVDFAGFNMHTGSIVVIFVGISCILLDLCIIVAVKSEIVKLRNKNKFDISRLSREGEATGKLRVEDDLKLEE